MICELIDAFNYYFFDQIESKQNKCVVPIDLPEEMILLIFSMLAHQDLCKIGLVCKKWRQWSEQEDFCLSLYRKIVKTLAADLCKMSGSYSSMGLFLRSVHCEHGIDFNKDKEGKIEAVIRGPCKNINKSDVVATQKFLLNSNTDFFGFYHFFRIDRAGIDFAIKDRIDSRCKKVMISVESRVKQLISSSFFMQHNGPIIVLSEKR